MLVVDSRKEILVAKCDRQLMVHQLVPDAVYTFAVSAKFADSGYGEVATEWLHLASVGKTNIQGKFKYE